MEPQENSYQITVTLFGVKKVNALNLAKAIDFVLDEALDAGSVGDYFITTSHIKDICE